MHCVAKEGQIVLAGRVAKDPQVKGSDGSFTVVTLAVDLGKRDGERQTEFVDITFTKKAAELAKKYLVKGQYLVVVVNEVVREIGDRKFTNYYVQNFAFGPKPRAAAAQKAVGE